jgi:hypothetical protein
LGSFRVVADVLALWTTFIIGDDSCSWAATIVQKAETQIRVEIERCGSNRTKVNPKTRTLQGAKPIGSANMGIEVQEKRKTVQNRVVSSLNAGNNHNKRTEAIGNIVSYLHPM